jgi:predicted lysophospholipase L1 biosynthesis ABC-type transport system permease subunit
VELEFQEKYRPQILARLAAEPVVQSMAAAASPPLDGVLPSVPALAAQRKAVSTWYNFVSPEYFDVLSIPIVRGRNFTGQEAAAKAPVIIVSQAAARKFWPNQNALGQSIQIVPEPGANPDARLRPYKSARVIGVAGDIMSCCFVIGKDPALVYLPATPSMAKTTLLVHVHGDDRVARRALDAGLSSISANAIDQIHPMEQFRASGVYPFRAMAWICSLLGGLALLLTLSGVYGVLSYLVTQRRKEIGIRMALGATAGSVSRLVLRQSLRLAVAGMLIGGLLAIGVSLWLASFIATMNVFDLPAYAAGALLVLVAAAAAAWIPSSRAARIDPITTLRYD